MEAMDAMEVIKTPKLENVQLVDKYNSRNNSRGTLYFATTHLIFVDHELKKETWILLMHISSVERLPITSAGCPLLVRTETFQSVQLVIPRERDCHDLHQTLLRLSRPAHIEELYCFFYKSSGAELARAAGWSCCDLRAEYERMNVPNDKWVLCLANANYELCDTYPRTLLVPAGAGGVLAGSARFRSRGRLPALGYLHRSGAAIARCSQPLSGFNARCPEDEEMMDSIRRANPNGGYMYVVDTRPRINAMVNRAAGKGYESESFYDNIKFKFSGIGNIHVMRKSLHKLVETCEQSSPTMSSFLSGLESSGWLKHVRCILQTSWWISTAVSEGRSVVVHCSDGWDRTAQTVSLAALLLDPHYRTISGYQALIEKDWLSFGHKFTERCGHISSDPRERSPVFTQFLDCTWQLFRQRPEAFQFNERFLLTLQEHAYSCQYGTFIGNSEKEREQLRLSERTYSLWGYMANHLNEYKNPLYDPKAHPDLLTPDLSSQSIRFWRGLYCQHESGVHPRDNPADTLRASAEHSLCLQSHIHTLTERISMLKGLLGRGRSKPTDQRETTRVKYMNGTGDAHEKLAQLHMDNKLTYESGLSELSATEDHPLVGAPPALSPAPAASTPAQLAALAVREVTAVALDWSSLKDVKTCVCSTAFDHLSTKHHCWSCGAVCCPRCVSRRAAPGVAGAPSGPPSAPLCALCRAASTPSTPITPATD